MIPQSEWEWFGSPGHFIAARDCQFRMATRVGKWLISTVGEYYPSGMNSEMSLGGDGRIYETMVFAAGKPCRTKTCKCGMPKINGRELELLGAFQRGDAAKNHMAMCAKWAKKEKADA